MEDMMKELFDDLVLDETKKSEIRKSIISTKTQKYTGVKIAITSLAAILLVLFSVPFTRNAIVSAATKCIKFLFFLMVKLSLLVLNLMKHTWHWIILMKTSIRLISMV